MREVDQYKVKNTAYKRQIDENLLKQPEELTKQNIAKKAEEWRKLGLNYRRNVKLFGKSPDYFRVPNKIKQILDIKIF